MNLFVLRFFCGVSYSFLREPVDRNIFAKTDGSCSARCLMTAEWGKLKISNGAIIVGNRSKQKLLPNEFEKQVSRPRYQCDHITLA